MGNIEQTEAELEQINRNSVDKYANEEKMISQLAKNTAYFEQLIHEKKIKKSTLESQMAKIRGQQSHGDSGKKTGPSFSLAAIAEGLTKSVSLEKINPMGSGGTIEKRNGVLEEAKKPSDADLMRRLRVHIFSLYLKVKGVKTQ